MPSRLPVIGVYKIGLSNETLYVGSSKNVLRRFAEHKSRLGKGKHVNMNLQTIANGRLNDVDFTILEVTTLKNLRVKEYEWTKRLNPPCNIMLIDSHGVSRHTEEHKHNMSINNPSKRPEVKKMRSIQLKKYNPSRDSQEVREKLRAAAVKQWSPKVRS